MAENSGVGMSGLLAWLPAAEQALREGVGVYTVNPNYVDNTDAAAVQCECGAKHVHWAANQHSDWCPVAIFDLQKESKW